MEFTKLGRLSWGFGQGISKAGDRSGRYIYVSYYSDIES